jgi:hypothetical protein
MRAITSGRKLSLYIYSERRIPGLSARFAVPVEPAPAAGFASAVELVSTADFALTVEATAVEFALTVGFVVTAEFARVSSLQQVLTL